MVQANKEVRDTIAAAGFTQWQVAYAAGVSAQTLSNWLRLPLSDDHHDRVLNALEKLKSGEVTVNV